MRMFSLAADREERCQAIDLKALNAIDSALGPGPDHRHPPPRSGRVHGLVGLGKIF